MAEVNFAALDLGAELIFGARLEEALKAAFKQSILLNVRQATGSRQQPSRDRRQFYRAISPVRFS